MPRKRTGYSKNGRSLAEIVAARTTPSSKARARANYGTPPKLRPPSGPAAPGGNDRRYFDKKRKPAVARTAGRRWS